MLHRIALVSDPALSEQPITVVRQVVNMALEREGKAPVSESTIYLDLQRAKELYREQIVNGVEARMLQLQKLWSKNWLALARTPEGPQMASLLAVGIRIVEDMAKLDGSWGRGPDVVVNVDQAQFGPSPRELADRGAISEGDYRGWLAVLSQQGEGRRVPELEPARVRDVEATDLDADLDTDAEPMPAAPRARGPQVRRGGGDDRLPPPGLPKPGKVVEWRPDDEEDWT